MEFAMSKSFNTLLGKIGAKNLRNRTDLKEAVKQVRFIADAFSITANLVAY